MTAKWHAISISGIFTYINYNYIDETKNDDFVRNL